MGFYSLDLDALSEFTGTSVEKLKNKPYVELESMIRDMNQAKIIEQNNRNTKDEEYERLVLKFFEPVNLLRHWFNEKEIVLACANTGVSIGDLCEEQTTEPMRNKTFYNMPNEYLRTSVESVRQYDKHGREYMEPARKMQDVYRVMNRYQGTRHGKVIEYLLYSRYPELKKFEFKCYSMGTGERDYEIYPNNHIYVSFTALMSGDVDWILHRNREYCKLYNNGRYTPEECEKAFRTEEALEMFDVIRSIGEQEEKAGHSPITRNSDGKLSMPNGMQEIRVSKSRKLALLGYERDDSRYKIACSPNIVGQLLNEFLSMITGSSKVNIQIRHVTDYLSDHSICVSDTKDPKLAKFVAELSDARICNTFGYMQNNTYNLTICIDKPDMWTLYEA